MFQIKPLRAWGAVATTLLSMAGSLFLISKAPWYLLPFAWALAGTAFTGVRPNKKHVNFRHVTSPLICFTGVCAFPQTFPLPVLWMPCKGLLGGAPRWRVHASTPLSEDSDDQSLYAVVAARISIPPATCALPRLCSAVLRAVLPATVSCGFHEVISYSHRQTARPKPGSSSSLPQPCVAGGSTHDAAP